MKKPIALGSLLLFTTALVPPAALAQTAGSQQTPAPSTPSTPAVPEADQADTAEDPGEQIEISGPGADTPEEGDEIVVTGRNIPNVIRATPEVISVLSTADIARSGEGDIAGALTRVTGLSVVSGGFVYVRGLGDRYSLALLNGSPLPSPEPLRRVVPLDIFPTSVLASAVVQKSYSVNYPGEFGGGVINLTTKSIPTEDFFAFGATLSGDSETTAELGYTYYGSDLDVLGYDDGTRDVPRGLANALAANGGLAGTTTADRQGFAAGLTNADTTLLQRNGQIPANVSGDFSAGKVWDFENGRFGIIASGGFSNSWRTRDVRQQSSLDPELGGIPQSDFQTVITDNRVVANGLLGLGLEIGENTLRWTTLYIHDTNKQGRLSSGADRSVADQDPGQPDSLIKQNTFFFERQLFESQVVGEFKFDDLSVDIRSTYANSKRESPYERGFSYAFNPTVGDYINNLASGGQTADVAFSDLNEDLYAVSGDIAYKLPSLPVTLSVGGAAMLTERTSSRYQFQYFRPNGPLDFAVAQERPDFLVSDFNIFTYGIELRDVSGELGSASYDAKLKTYAGYGQIEAEPIDGVRATVGVRYEDATQTVIPTGNIGTRIVNDYFLPAATVTFNFADNMQIRLAASKTIARPQFRELAPQIFQDFEFDRQFTGNPFLTDSRLTNAEARYEWYFARDQRFSLAGFYKKLKDPIEAAAFFSGGGILRTGFANAPEAILYGAEVEIQKYVPLEGLGNNFFASKRLVLIGNYTYTKSELKVGSQLVFGPDLRPVAANLLFEDGAPLTGQSDHIANLQIGIEDTDKLQQFTLLLNYASDRVTNRGPIQGLLRQPDLTEKPGFRVDFVAREGFDFLGTEMELKFEARNITGTDYQEFQQADANRIDINRFKVGTSLSLGFGVKF